MKFSSIPPGLALAAALALSSAGAFAASEPHALSESEMSAVYGRGLSEPALTALGALSTQEQGNSAVSAAAANDALVALSADGALGIDRQMAQQRLQATTSSIQANMKAAQMLANLNSLLAPLAGSLPLMPIPLLFALPALPSLPAIQNKH